VEVIPFALFKHCLLSFCFDLLGSSDLRVEHGSAYAVVRRGILLCFVSLLYCCFTAALLLLYCCFTAAAAAAAAGRIRSGELEGWAGPFCLSVELYGICLASFGLRFMMGKVVDRT
jgi:hypothetical protein